MTGRELLGVGRGVLAGRGTDAPGREAARLLAAVLGCSETGLLAFDEEPVDAEREHAFRALLSRRAAGEPMAYLLGEREFFGRGFAVDHRVLVPRPETEHLVEIALALPLPAAARVLDLGTGSGALAVTLAAERPLWRVAAGDISLGALALARHNRDRLAGAERVAFFAADLAGALDLAAFDLVVSNPPYVDPSEVAALPRDVRDFEPPLAFVSPAGGTRFAARLLAETQTLRPGAFLAFEIGAGQREAVLELAETIGGWRLVEVRFDLAGLARDVVFRRSGEA